MLKKKQENTKRFEMWYVSGINPELLCCKQNLILLLVNTCGISHWLVKQLLYMVTLIIDEQYM